MNPPCITKRTCPKVHPRGRVMFLMLFSSLRSSQARTSNLPKPTRHTEYVAAFAFAISTQSWVMEGGLAGKVWIHWHQGNAGSSMDFLSLSFPFPPSFFFLSISLSLSECVIQCWYGTRQSVLEDVKLEDVIWPIGQWIRGKRCYQCRQRLQEDMTLY